MERPDGAQEARDAIDRYEALWVGVGADFRAELDAALARIRQNPQLHAAESRSIRTA